MFVAHPYSFDVSGRTASAGEQAHVRGLIEQLLFTAPSERVMHPELGSGIAQFVFAHNSPEIAGATQMLVQGALQRWLGDLLQVTRVEVRADDTTLRVLVEYHLRRTGQLVQEQFVRGAGGTP